MFRKQKAWKQPGKGLKILSNLVRDPGRPTTNQPFRHLIIGNKEIQANAENKEWNSGQSNSGIGQQFGGITVQNRPQQMTASVLDRAPTKQKERTASTKGPVKSGL